MLYLRHYYFIPSTVQSDPLPRTLQLIAKEQYIDAKEYLEYFMQFEYMRENEEAKKILKSINDKRGSLGYKGKKILDGILTGNSDEIGGQISAIGSDFFLIGDIRDLLIESSHYFADEEVDEVLVALSSIGIAATASTIMTLGSSTVPKAGISILKIARKNNRMPSWLGKFLSKEAKIIKETKSIKHIEPFLETIHSLYKNAGLKGSMILLSTSKGMKQLTNISQYTKRFGKQSHILLDISKGKILKHLPSLQKASPQSIMLASTYGERGFKGLSKVGEKRFVKSIKIYKGIAKSGYRGNLMQLLYWLLKHLSDTLLIAIALISSVALLPWRRIKLAL